MGVALGDIMPTIMTDHMVKVSSRSATVHARSCPISVIGLSIPDMFILDMPVGGGSIAFILEANETRYAHAIRVMPIRQAVTISRSRLRSVSTARSSIIGRLNHPNADSYRTQLRHTADR